MPIVRMEAEMNRTFIKNKNKQERCRKYSISPQELSRIFEEWLRMMENQRRNRVVIAKTPEPPIKKAPVIRAPQPPQPQPRRVAVAPPKQRKARSPKPLVITITILHECDENGNDVVFSKSGTAPKDIDVSAFEDYVAAFFGQDSDEEDYEDEDLCDDDEYEE